MRKNVQKNVSARIRGPRGGKLSLWCRQDDPVIQRYKKLNEALVGVIEDYSLVSFIALDIHVGG